MRSIRRIKRLAKEWDAEVIFTHDMEVFRTYPWLPSRSGQPGPGWGGACGMKLSDRVAVVTGAAQGIGRAIAEKLSAEGATVVAVDLNGDGATEVASRLDGLAIAADIAGEEDCARVAGATMDRYGKIDVLVNAAAIVPFIPWDELDFAYWRKIISVNLDGAYLISRAVRDRCAPPATAGSSRSPRTRSWPARQLAPYLAAKGGVIGLTRALATELGGYGITANAVAPGITRTEGSLATPHKDAFDFVQSLQAIPRHGLPEDIAPAVAFLASEESGWITGQVLVADAGHIRD